MKLPRREFLRTVGIATAWSMTAKAEPARSANNIVRVVGVIGTGVRGKYLIGNLPECVRVTAICDCATLRTDSTLEPTGPFATVLQQFKERDAAHCAVYQDYRRLSIARSSTPSSLPRRTPSHVACDARSASRLGCVSREATDRLHSRRPVAGRDGKTHGPGAASWQPTTHDGSQSFRLRVHSQRWSGEDLEGRTAVLSRAAARYGARRRAYFRRASISICFVVRRHYGPSSQSLDEGGFQSRQTVVARLGSVSRLLGPLDDQLGSAFGRHGGAARAWS